MPSYYFQVSVNDNLPKLSCSKCIFNLYFVENVRNTIIKSDEKLRTIIDRDGSLNELLKSNPVIQLEDDTCSNTDDLNYNHVEIKEEIFSPVNSCGGIPDSDASEHCDSNVEDLNKNVPEKTCIDDILDENDIKKIIYKKDNNKPYLYHCNVCNVDFRGNVLYLRHKGKHIKKTCEICGVTTRQDNFNKHMTKHKLGQQVCDICGSIHKSLEGLRTHLFHFHNAKKKLYTCGECGESFKYSHRLTYHKRKIHTGMQNCWFISLIFNVLPFVGFRPHQCDTCGKRFFDLGTMKKHVKLIHLKLREYHCKYCQKDYSSQYALKVHIRQHTDETPYICEICTEGFRQLVSLKTHMAKHERASIKKSDAECQEGEAEKGTKNDLANLA